MNTFIYLFKHLDGAKLLILKCYKITILWLYPKYVSGSIQVLKQVDKSNHNIWKKKSFVLGSYEYLEKLEGKIRKCLFCHVKIF